MEGREHSYDLSAPKPARSDLEVGERVTDREQRSAAPTADLLTAVAEAASDRSGVDTFARYIWQAKQAVRQWLSCLSDEVGPSFVVCEQVEDIALIYPNRVRFLQLKTRDRGSWSASYMCNHGLDALTRSYSASLDAGLHELATFELWLQGPIADSANTLAFVKEPTSASNALRDKIMAVGAERSWLDDFLGRLVIRPDQPTRTYIDAIIIREIGALWPSLSIPELEQIYERLLIAATAAQSAQPTPVTVQAHLTAVVPFLPIQSSKPTESCSDALAAIREQILSRDALLALTPPLPGEPVERLFARLSTGSASSMLELKMSTAGASAKTIRRTQEMRADMEVKRQLLMASRSTAENDLERLARRVLTVADATARKIALSAATNPSAAARPAEAIVAELLSRPGDLGQLDNDHLFDSDGLTVYGFLGHLSDLCRYEWRAA